MAIKVTKVDSDLFVEGMIRSLRETPQDNLAHQHGSHVTVRVERAGSEATFNVISDATHETLMTVSLSGELSDEAVERFRTLMQVAENGEMHTADDLDRMNLAWDTKSWSCDYCDETFHTKKEAEEHERTHKEA